MLVTALDNYFTSLVLPPTLKEPNPVAPIEREDLKITKTRAFLLHNLLSPLECKDLIAQMESVGFNSLCDKFPSQYRLNDRFLSSFFLQPLFSSTCSEISI